MKLEDYTVEFCPWCCEEVVIHATGVTACLSCGKAPGPLLRLLGRLWRVSGAVPLRMLWGEGGRAEARHHSTYHPRGNRLRYGELLKGRLIWEST